MHAYIIRQCKLFFELCASARENKPNQKVEDDRYAHRAKESPLDDQPSYFATIHDS
jgi:hypothetical protein